MVDISWSIKVRNTGPQHDIIAGCSLLDPNTGEELVEMPWWIIWDVPTNNVWTTSLIWSNVNIPSGTYLAKARAWTSYSGSPTKIMDLATREGIVIGAVYQAGTGLLHDWLDEATQTLVVSPALVSADIEQFTITV